MSKEITYWRIYGGDAPKGEWRIGTGFPGSKEKILWRMPVLPEHDDLEEPPAELRAAYERLTGKKNIYVDPVADPGNASPNIVEMLADGECGFDQACQFGYRVETHAVYCHNESWLYAPRKCRRTWYTGGETKDETCPGFAPNKKLEAK